MPLPLFTGATNTVQLLADRPNQTDGLTPAQLKLKFDQHAINYETYSNDTLVPAINVELQNKTDNLTTHKASTDHDGRYYTELEIDDKVALLATKSEIYNVVLGQIPPGSITDEQLSNEPGMIKSQLADMGTKQGDLANLQTTDKTSLVKAINELFTNANNGKQNWVDVVGSPLVNTDAFATLKSKTQTLKDTMASNLTNKGQSSVGTEGLSALVNKIASISTGKRWATGVINAIGDTSSPGTTVYDLAFVPSIVIVRIDNTSYSVYCLCGLVKDFLEPGNNTFFSDEYNATAKKITMDSIIPTTNRFTFKYYRGSAYNENFKWLALE